MRVVRWGKGLAVLLPSSVVKVLQLKPGDDVDIHVAGARTLDIARAGSVREVLARLRAFRGKLPADFKFDRTDASERG